MLHKPPAAKSALTEIASADPDGAIVRDIKAKLDASLTESVLYIARELGGREQLGRREWNSLMTQHFELPDFRLTVNLLRKLAETYLERLKLTTDEFKSLGFKMAVALLPRLERLTSDDEVLCASAAVRRYIAEQQFHDLDQNSAATKIAETRPADVSDTTVIEPSTDEARQSILAILSSQILRAPLRNWPPAPTDFDVSPALWRHLLLSVQLESNTLLMGPPGCGKTELIGRLAAAIGRPIAVFSFGAMSDPRTSLVGTTQFDPQRGTYFVNSRFARAIETPNTLVLLDELNRADSDVTNMLLSLLDGQRTLSIDESGQMPVVNVATGVCFLATLNVGNAQYAGTRPLDPALRDRFGTIISMDHLPKEREANLLIRRERISLADAKLLVKIAEAQRQLAANGDFAVNISTRMLIATAGKARFMPISEAIQYSILGHFSDSGGESSDRTRMRQLLQKFGVVV